MTKEEWVRKVCEFVNYHDGGHMEPYVADKLADYLIGTLGMLPPPHNVDILTREPNPRGGANLYDWEEKPNEKDDGDCDFCVPGQICTHNPPLKLKK